MGGERGGEGVVLGHQREVGLEDARLSSSTPGATCTNFCSGTGMENRVKPSM